MTEHEPVAVVVIDASPDFRWILRRVFQRKGGFDVVGDTDDAAHGLELVRHHQPGLVLIDVDDPGTDVAGLVQQLRTSCPQASVVATMSVGRREVLDTVLEAGGTGTIRKGVTLQHTFDQLWSVLADRSGEQTAEAVHPR